MISPNYFVSVIIPVYNDSERLKLCLEALEKQTYSNKLYEVIVIDNGSDESIEPLVARFKQARASCDTTQRGPCVARNRGVLLARGKVIAFTDSDCIPNSDWIEQGVAVLQSVPNCGIVGGKVDIFFKNAGNPMVPEIYDSIWHLNQKRYIEKANFSATSNLFTYKHVFHHVGDFAINLLMSEDREWGQRVASFGYRLVYSSDVCVKHPARYSLTELKKKVKRTAIGNARIDKRKSLLTPIVNRDFLYGLIPPVITVIRLKNKYRMNKTKIIEFMQIWLALRYIEIKERIKIMLK